MASDEILFERLRQAFLDFGYEQLTMSRLAQLCGMTRRGLYNHFSNKDDAFRHMLRVGNERSTREGMAAGRAMRDASVADIMGEIMNVRYGEARRRLAASPHALEINDQAFRRANEIMMEAATVFQQQLSEFLTELQASGQLQLRQGIDVDELAQLLADGARGVNQARPPVAPEKLAGRYRNMCRAILHGCVDV
ncbi:MAG TPA: helix-turn-helix domain-containing protein [Rhizobiaceae bacterium]|nr:helix-turn-helix domain-containing protein [Rhizobiaceae bacterium]